MQMGENAQRSAVRWEELVPPEDWQQYLPVLDLASERKIAFALAGGLAFSEYSGRLRNTKDVDLLVTPEQRGNMMAVLSENGWSDYADVEPYDRSWIYRACKGNLICDIIWSLPNHRFDIDHGWVTNGPEILIYGRRVRLIGKEHLILAKLFVFQRDRCDWPDLLNVIACSGEQVDWTYVLQLVGRDRALLGGLLNVFRWLAPEKAHYIPAFVWKEVGLQSEVIGEPAPEENRAFLLDTRDWFGANVGGTDC